MSVLKTLRETVAPELNHLYTVAPSETAAGVECGWRGREHALHAFFVARLFGADAELCTGDFAVLSRWVPPLTSLGRDAGHAWCRISGVAPVDLSLTFLHFGSVPQLRSAIVGEGRNGDWHVQYAYDESPMDENVQDRNEIIYIERTVLAPEAEEELLRNPHALLPAPAPEDAGSWTARFGPDIHAKISLHCFRCANGDAKSPRHRMNGAQLVEWIAGNYSDPAAQIRKILTS
jgi:hypothetical protein